MPKASLGLGGMLESIVIHEAAEVLYRQYGNPSALEFELKHKRITERFGRYSHRNEVLVDCVYFRLLEVVKSLSR